MWKVVVAGVTALAIAGGSLVYAQGGPGGPGGPGGRVDGPRWRPSAEDMSAFSDARIAALKAGLRLTADQETLWPPLEKALHDGAKLRAERFAARASADRPSDPVERLQTRADRMTKGGAALKAIADAATPLYKSLDDAQKHRFRVLARLGAQHRGMWRRHHGGPGGMMERDRGGPGGPMERGPRDEQGGRRSL